MMVLVYFYLVLKFKANSGFIKLNSFHFQKKIVGMFVQSPFGFIGM